MKLLVIDNYDSFTYNLVQLFGEMDETCPTNVAAGVSPAGPSRIEVVVKRNDEIPIDEIKNVIHCRVHWILRPRPRPGKSCGYNTANFRFTACNFIPNRF